MNSGIKETFQTFFIKKFLLATFKGTSLAVNVVLRVDYVQFYVPKLGLHPVIEMNTGICM